MSLINKMLRDLDERHASAEDRNALPEAVHVMREKRPAKRPWMAVALVLALAAVAYLWLVPGGLPPAAVPPVPPPPALVAAAPAPTPPVEPAPAPSSEPAPASAPAPEPMAAPTAPQVAASTSAALPETPAKKAVAAPVLRKEPLPSRSEKTTNEPAPAKPVVAAKEPPAAAVSADPASIDKRPRTAPVNEAAESQYRKAMAALRRGAVNEAQEGFRATLRIDAHYVSARQALMSLLVEQQQLAEAQTLLEEGLTLDPAQTSWAMALARLQLENGKLAEALDTLARHARQAEQSPEYQAFHALLLQKQKRYHDAAERYRAALALKPAESRWWYGLGLVLELDQKPKDAREAFLKARETGNLPQELIGAVEQRLR